MAKLPRLFNKLSSVWIVYGVLALLLLLPLLRPGYVLVMDMVFTPHITLPPVTQSSFPFYVLLWVLSAVLPVWFVQKLLLVGIIVISGVGMHRLVLALLKQNRPHVWAAYTAGLFYVVNPFTYSRFMAGQFAVLLGYSMLPWFVRQLYRYQKWPDMWEAIKLALWTVLIAVVSVHSLGEVVVLVLAALIVWAIWGRKKRSVAVGVGHMFAAMGIALVLCSYWLVPVLAGRGKTAETIAGFSSHDQQAFTTVGGNVFAKIINILHLQGFWLEARNLYLLPQARMPIWGIVSMAVLVLVAFGMYIMWQQRLLYARYFLIVGVAAALIAAGAFDPLFARLPLIEGLREPHKFTGLLALVFALALGYSAQALSLKLRKYARLEQNIAMSALLCLPLVFTPTFLWGFASQLHATDYPRQWYEVNQRLNNDADNFQVLFLPWHQYMSFRFTGRIIANPAHSFFDKTTIVSNDPEFNGAAPGNSDSEASRIDKILDESKNSQTFALRLAERNVKYVVVAHELDYKEYDRFMKQPTMKLIASGPDMTIYQNTQWRVGAP